MSLYIITKVDDQQINSPVFHAGTDGNEEAVVVFTSSSRANDYVKSAGWGGQESIAELQSREFLRWLLTANFDGATLLAVDPENHFPSDRPQPTMSIPDLVDELGQIAAERILLPPPAMPPKLKSMDILHCQKCGKLIEQKSGETSPECCGRPMVVAAHDSIELPVSK